MGKGSDGRLANIGLNGEREIEGKRESVWQVIKKKNKGRWGY